MNQTKLIAASIIALCTFMGVAFGQQIQPCYSTETIEHIDHLHPGYKLRIDEAFEQAKQFALEMRSSRAVNADTLYRIPVVVHIVYTNAIQNIPDSLITSQIQVLNRDYNRLNEDAIQTRDIFKPIAGSLHFEFFLATTDPAGNPTSGVIRKLGTPASTFLGFNAFQDNVKNAAEGDAAWNTDKYLNIWVCNLNTLPLGVLGYAFPPTGASNWDSTSYIDSAMQGVVIDYTAFGRNNPYVIDPGVLPGRTCVHEVGHYFGLRHIWADETACAADDGIDDTPMAGDKTNFTCDTTKNSCVDAGVDYPDMSENYMDYTDERCQNIFTVGQTTMMLSNLILLRPSLAQKVLIDVGVGAINGIQSISIFPNPCSDFLNIKLKQVLAENFDINIYNSTGSKVLSKQLSSSEFNQAIDIRSLENGIYFFELSNAKASYRSKLSKF